MAKKTTLLNIIRTIPEQIYVSVLNQTMGTSLKGIEEFCELAPFQARDYFFTVLRGLDSAVYQNRDNIESSYKKFNPSATILSKRETTDRCFVALQNLDLRLYEIHALPENTPDKWEFEFTTKTDWEAYLKILEKLPRRGGPNILPKKTIFDKEDFLRNMKNALWDYFDFNYELST